MKIKKLFQPVSITLETEEEVKSLRDACFASNDPLAIGLAKQFNSLYPRRKGNISPHRKKRHSKSVYNSILEVLTSTPQTGSSISSLLPEIKRQSIFAALTELHQEGLVIRSHVEGSKLFTYSSKE